MNTSLHVVCPQCLAVNRIPSLRLAEKPKCGKCHRPLFTATPVELNGAAFQRHMARNDIPLLVDFWAPWCGPCHMMAPAFAQAASQLEPHVRLARVNTENEQQIAAAFNIMSMPTLALFRNGREIARQPGALGVDDIVRWTRGYL